MTIKSQTADQSPPTIDAASMEELTKSPAAPNSTKQGSRGIERPDLRISAPVLAHNNNFGAIRLLLATLVIIGHSVPLALGTQNSGIGARIIRMVAPHELAVDGFFLLSGYLITSSVQRSRTASYLRKRVGRIYPGFAVAYVISLLFAAFSGGELTGSPVQEALWHALSILRLAQPQMSGAYPGNPYQVVNGSLWTCAYEFWCYLMILAVFRLKLLSNKIVIPFITVVLIIAAIIFHNSDIFLLQKMFNTLRLTSLFLVGGIYYSHKDFITYNNLFALLSAFILIAVIFANFLTFGAVAIFGSYLLFWCAFKKSPLWLRKIGENTDISFGVYLYAWPIQSLLVWCNRGVGPLALCLLTIPIAYCAGILSWFFVERYFIQKSRQSLSGNAPAQHR